METLQFYVTVECDTGEQNILLHMLSLHILQIYNNYSLCWCIYIIFLGDRLPYMTLDSLEFAEGLNKLQQVPRQENTV